MSRIFLYLLPSIIPLVLYLISFAYANRRAIRHGHEKPKFLSKELYRAFTLSLIIAVICFLVFVFIYFTTTQEGEYVPAKIENDKLIKGYKQ